MKRIYLRRLYTLSAVAVLLLAGLAGCRRTEGLGEMTPDGYLPAKENLMVGIKIYFGSEREYIGEMLGENGKFPNGPRGGTVYAIKIREADGTDVWRPRSYIANNHGYVVKADDRALSKKEWKILTN